MIIGNRNNKKYKEKHKLNSPKIIGQEKTHKLNFNPTATNNFKKFYNTFVNLRRAHLKNSISSQATT